MTASGSGGDRLGRWGAAHFVLYWGALLAVSGGVLVAYRPAALEGALLPGAAAATILLGIGLALRRRTTDARLMPDVSLGAPALAVGLVTLAIGLLLGRWLAMIGAGLALLALVALARELATQRTVRR